MTHDAYSIGLDLVRAYVVAQLYADGIVPPHGVETRELHLLFRLRDEGPMTQAELGRALLREPMSVTRMVRSLEERGLVQRTSAEDARALQVALTAHGERVLTRAVGALEENDPFADWSKRDLDQLRSMLRRVRESMTDACIRAGIRAERGDGDERAASRRRVVRARAKEPLPGAAKRKGGTGSSRDRVRGRTR